VSTNWKDKNGLHDSIQYKIAVLTQEYGLSEQEIVGELFVTYLERDHYRKYACYAELGITGTPMLH